MEKTPLWENISIIPRQTDVVMDTLRRIPVFEGIPYRGLKAIRSLCHLRNYREDEHIFRTGEPGVGMYIIIEGSIEIYRKKDGAPFVYGQLESGDFFGELAMLEDLPRSASARSIDKSTLLGFFRPDLLSLLARNPRLASLIILNMARLTGRKLLKTNDLLEKTNEELEALKSGARIDE